jgi:hypothetical protein
MRYAAIYKPDSKPFDLFIQRKGGINECAVRFSRWMGRGLVRGHGDGRLEFDKVVEALIFRARSLV